MPNLTTIIITIATSLIKILLGRWLNKDPEKEQIKNALEAKKKEAEIMAAPARDESVVDDILLSRASQRERDKDKH